MRIANVIVLALWGGLVACNTVGEQPSIGSIDQRLDRVEKRVDENADGIAVAYGRFVLVNKSLDALDGRIRGIARDVGDLLWRVEALEELEPQRGERGPRGLDGADGRDGIDGRDGLDGYPKSKGDMTVITGSSATVAGPVEVEAFCASPRDIAISGSCKLAKPADECRGVGLLSWGTFDNDHAWTNAGFGCTFSSAVETDCEVVAVVDCIHIP